MQNSATGFQTAYFPRIKLVDSDCTRFCYQYDVQIESAAKDLDISLIRHLVSIHGLGEKMLVMIDKCTNQVNSITIDEFLQKRKVVCALQCIRTTVDKPAQVLQAILFGCQRKKCSFAHGPVNLRIKHMKNKIISPFSSRGLKSLEDAYKLSGRL